ARLSTLPRTNSAGPNRRSARHRPAFYRVARRPALFSFPRSGSVGGKARLGTRLERSEEIRHRQMTVQTSPRLQGAAFSPAGAGPSSRPAAAKKSWAAMLFLLAVCFAATIDWFS